MHTRRLSRFLTFRMTVLHLVLGVAACLGLVCGPAQAQQPKPNILVIMGDDIGWFNPSAYHQGMMGYRTPNIDRIAQEGARFTDWYGQQSCTAGRTAFITEQSPIRTGLTKVGLPGGDIGLRPENPTIAEILKPLAYATGQFGKNRRSQQGCKRHGQRVIVGVRGQVCLQAWDKGSTRACDPGWRDHDRVVHATWAAPSRSISFSRTLPVTTRYTSTWAG